MAFASLDSPRSRRKPSRSSAMAIPTTTSAPQCPPSCHVKRHRIATPPSWTCSRRWSPAKPRTLVEPQRGRALEAYERVRELVAVAPRPVARSRRDDIPAWGHPRFGRPNPGFLEGPRSAGRRRCVRALLHHHRHLLSQWRPHIGDAYEAIAADVIARHKRSRGQESASRPAPTNMG